MDKDRLYRLLPSIYRLRDNEQGEPLRALLQVVAEQVEVIEQDIGQLYENWFLETCQEWVVPYLGDLVGYTPLAPHGDDDFGGDARGAVRERLLIPRREVANTIRFRRRKGTVAVLEDLAIAVASWPARAVESSRLVAVTQNVSLPRPEAGRLCDIRDGHRLEALGGPFATTSLTADVRSVGPSRSSGGDRPDLCLHVWRLQTFPVTKTPAYCYEEVGPNCYLFSVLGNDTPLYNRTDGTAVPRPDKLDLPVPISRRDLAHRCHGVSGVDQYYGEGKSFAIWLGSANDAPVAPEKIVAADLTDWKYRPLPGEVAVDPVLGRIVFPPEHRKQHPVWVSYSYAFSAAIGGGEYGRPITQPHGSTCYLVGKGDRPFKRINDALSKWEDDNPAHAVIEITDSGVYQEQIAIRLKSGQSLQLRAADKARPVIRLLDWKTSEPDDLTVTGKGRSWFTLDGVLVTGRGIRVHGGVEGVTIRHSTLVPGWGLTGGCHPANPSEASLLLDDAPARLRIEHSIVGAIVVNRNEVRREPCLISISDSVVDPAGPEQVAIGAAEEPAAFASLEIRRCTVLGAITVHSIALGENSLFMGRVFVSRRQIGCLRFCYVSPDRSGRTPTRYRCQPDLADAALLSATRHEGLSRHERDRLLAVERLRVRPQFASIRYGTPQYCRLVDSCLPEITGGADDLSEMGVFHDLYQTQRAANLVTRLEEFVPAGTTAAVIYCS